MRHELLHAGNIYVNMYAIGVNLSMRMRHKKNLWDRLEKCGGLYFNMYSDDRNFVTSLDKKEYLDYKEIFGNDNPVEMEIGCGKGQFIAELAQRNPDINYIAVEKTPDVIVLACEKIRDLGIKNVFFMKGSAEYLPKYIPNGTIKRIYLNFSCPFPKKKYAKHRLTHENFLSLYKEMLSDGAEIHQKTDNMHFFEFSIEQFTNCGFALKNVSLDLHASDFEGNIVTEYEKRFSDLGQPIYRLEAYIK